MIRSRIVSSVCEFPQLRDGHLTAMRSTPVSDGEKYSRMKRDYLISDRHIEDAHSRPLLTLLSARGGQDACAGKISSDESFEATSSIVQVGAERNCIHLSQGLCVRQVGCEHGYCELL
jgi:hypothetical protein